jgi:hypothetical protein
MLDVKLQKRYIVQRDSLMNLLDNKFEVSAHNCYL